MEWFTRYGQLVTEKVFNQNEAKGTAEYTYWDTCSRCGGAGGAEQWKMTGWTCFACSGRRGEWTTGKLYSAEKLAKMNATQEKRDATRMAKAQVKAAAEEAERLANLQSNREAFDAAHPGVASWLEENHEGNDFLDQMHAKLTDRGILSVAQAEAVKKEQARREEKAKAQYIGEVGKRIDLTITVERTFWPERHGYQRFAPSGLYLCRDENGNRIVYRGAGNGMPYKGETAKIKATVEQHTEYQGEKQTIIARPKILEQIVSIYDDAPVAAEATA